MGKKWRPFKYFKSEHDQPKMSRISHLHDKTVKKHEEGIIVKVPMVVTF